MQRTFMACYSRTCHRTLLFLILFIAGLSSCKTTRQSTTFMTLPKDTSIRAFVNPGYDPVIALSDVLSVSVSSLNRDLDDRFNAASSATVGEGVSQRTGYFLDKDGNIELHYLGKVKAAGLSTGALAKKIQDDLSPFLKEPIVRVQFLNHRVTVMGEVSSPKVLYMNGSSMTLVDALVNAGDLKETADRAKVMVIRDSNDVKQVKHLNLESHEVVASPWFYMQPNDIVYVMPRTDKIDKEERKRNIQTTASLIISGLSLLTILLSRINN